jgi:hypothetical protein
VSGRYRPPGSSGTPGLPPTHRRCGPRRVSVAGRRTPREPRPGSGGPAIRDSGRTWTCRTMAEAGWPADRISTVPSSIDTSLGAASRRSAAPAASPCGEGRLEARPITSGHNCRSGSLAHPSGQPHLTELPADPPLQFKDVFLARERGSVMQQAIRQPQLTHGDATGASPSPARPGHHASSAHPSSPHRMHHSRHGCDPAPTVTPGWNTAPAPSPASPASRDILRRGGTDELPMAAVVPIQSRSQPARRPPGQSHPTVDDHRARHRDHRPGSGYRRDRPQRTGRPTALDTD